MGTQGEYYVGPDRAVANIPICYQEDVVWDSKSEGANPYKRTHSELTKQGRYNSTKVE